MNKHWEHLYTDFEHWEYAEISDQRSKEIERIKLELLAEFRKANTIEKDALREILDNPEAASTKKYFSQLYSGMRHFLATDYRKTILFR